MKQTQIPAVSPAIRGSVWYGVVAGAGVSLALTGIGFMARNAQLRDVAGEIGFRNTNIGGGFLIVGCVLVGLGILALGHALRHRRSVQRWPVSVAAFLAASYITGNLAGFVSSRYLLGLLL